MTASKSRAVQEALVTELRSDHARARAMDLLAMVDPLANDEESRRLRELAIRYLEVAQQLEAEEDGGAEPSEMISAALDAVARDYFSHMLRLMASDQEKSYQEDKWDGG
jgi:hypothetical protein